VLNKIPIGDKQKMKEIFGNYNVYPLENSLLHLNLVNILSTRIIFLFISYRKYAKPFNFAQVCEESAF
jgi:hypothetical protein